MNNKWTDEDRYAVLSAYLAGEKDKEAIAKKLGKKPGSVSWCFSHFRSLETKDFSTHIALALVWNKYVNNKEIK